MNRSRLAAALRVRPWKVVGKALVVCVVPGIAPAPAFAHGSLAVGDFYSGMLHPLLHFETLLPILALALWSGQLGQRHAWHLPLAFLASALLGALAGLWNVDLVYGPMLLQFSMLALGLLVALRSRLPTPLALTMVLLFGVYQGQTNTYDPQTKIERPLLFIAGLVSSIGLILFHVVSRVARYRAFWVQTAVRVLGSWIAATGLLVAALAWAVDP